MKIRLEMSDGSTLQRRITGLLRLTEQKLQRWADPDATLAALELSIQQLAAASFARVRDRNGREHFARRSRDITEQK